MGLIKGYKEGSNITILNNWYRRPAKKLNDKYDDGSMTVVYRDNDTYIGNRRSANGEVWYTWGSNEWSFKNKRRTIKIKEE